jgi:hypothetical protein
VAAVASLLVIGTAASTGLMALPASAAPVAKATASHASPRPQAVQAAPAIPAGARPVGVTRPDAKITGDVVLKPRSSAAVTKFIAQVTDRNSPLFHHYLPAGAFANKFGPAKATISRAVAALKASGLSVTSVARDGLLIHFSGTSKAIANAFHTKLENYRLKSGFVGRATTSAVRLPGTIAGSVAAVTGLNDLVRLQPEGIVRAPAKDRGKIRPAKTASFSHPAGSPVACKAATSAAVGFGGLTDDQIAHAYGATGLYGSGDLGQGQHIALYELEPFARSDVKAFDTCFYGAKNASQMLTRLHAFSVDGGQPTGPGSGESILDIEDLAGIAPDASIDVYVGTSPGSDGLIYDPVDPYAAMINTDTDQIISTSWGLCEQAVETGQPGLQIAENELFEQAAAQGQSIFSASGDNGSDDCNTNETSTPIAGQNPLSEDDPSGQPYVTAVGGTTIDDAASTPPLEHVWNDGSTEGGGGGGISQSWVMPSWQATATVPGIDRPGGAAYKDANQIEKSFGYPQNFCQATVTGAANSPCRLLPDVSAQADQFTGAITIFEAVFGGWTTIGGTSSATPIWAATLALVNASSTCTSNPATAHGVGFASPLLYAVASNAATYSTSFNDIRTGNNDLYGLDNGKVFNATKGYDLASGLGTPRLSGPGGSNGLAFNLCSLGGQASRPVVSGLAPTQGSVNGGTSLTITGTGFTSGGGPDVSFIQVGDAKLAPSQFHVVNGTTITTTVPAASLAVPPLSPSPQDGAGPANVIVTLKGDVSSRPSPASTFEYVDTGFENADFPSVTGVLPVAGRQSSPKVVTILGADFSTASSVTFGGVPATSFTVVSDNRITATPPPLSSGPSCAPLPHTGVYAGDTTTNDICQVQVRVGNSNFHSRVATILPPDEGALTLNVLDVLVPPAGCGCEIEQAPTEYDYVPTPTITSVSTSSGGAANLASENGTTVITVHGTGLDPLTIDWADFGPANQASSQNTNFTFITGTELQITAPAQATTTGPLKVPFSVNTLAGQSAPVSVAYAGVPTVTGVVNTKNHSELSGVFGAVDTGGAPLRVAGTGFAGGQLINLEFNDPTTPFSTGTQYTFTVAGDKGLTTQSVQQNAALVDVRACTVTGCSKAVKADKLWIYPPGKSDVTSVSPSSGPAAGGTKVTIGGVNLGCPIGVFFGSTPAKKFAATPGLLDCGSTVTLTATSPAGKKGTKAAVSVETVGSFFSHTGHGTSNAKFTYK